MNDEQAKAELKKYLGDRNWRLNNLYYVLDKNGNKVKFKFNFFQKIIMDQVWFFNVILKARQLGVTTFFCILYLDAVLFKPNQTANIIAHTKLDAQKIFKRVKFAFDNLPEELKNQLEVVNDSVESMTFQNGSSFSVTVSTRSGTVQYLHISEFGYICQNFPEKANEIITGALNSVEQGNMISIESTAKGRAGKFFEMCKDAEKLLKRGLELSPLDFKFFFFPWWQNPEYVLYESFEVLPKEMVEYFDKLDHEGIKLNHAQKQWYYAKWRTQKDGMFSEYPSTSLEAFMNTNEQAYYGKFMAKAVNEKRIGFVPHVPGVPVDTYWDLGRNDLTVILFVQNVGKEIRFINEYHSRLEGLPHYANKLRAFRDDMGYTYGSHYLPHDVEVTELSTNKSRKKTLQDLGVNPILVVPRLDVNFGIEQTRNVFGRFWFDEVRCAKLVEWIENYQQRWDEFEH